MRFFTVLASLACLAMALGQERNELLREMMTNDADFDSIHEKFKADFDMPLTQKKSCKFSVTATATASTEKNPYITSYVECEGEVLYNTTTKLSKLKPKALDKGIHLFHDTPFGGAAYVYLKDSPNLEFVDVEMKNLPQLHSKNLVAPLVIEDGRVECTKCTFENNVFGELAGAVLVGGSANAEFYRGDFYKNSGAVGAVRVRGGGFLEIEQTIFDSNKGTIVGGVMVEEKAALMAKDLRCNRNLGKERSTTFYITGKSASMIHATKFIGDDADTDFVDFLTNREAADERIDEFNLARAGAIEVDGKTMVTIRDSEFSGNSARYGAIVSSEGGVVDVRSCTFKKNAAFNGAGIFVQGGRGSYARVMDSTFVENSARYGGAMVVAGNGTFVVDECNFASNKALRGGAIWGDYSNTKTLVNGTCERSAHGSRVTIEKSSFSMNTATDSGGAFYVKCTDISTTKSTFEENSAHLNGGAMFVEDVFDLDFFDCDFNKNKAGQSGGSLYVRNSHDIFSRNSKFTGCSAESSGGAIASIKGHGVIIGENSIVTGNEAFEGGAVYSMGVEKIESRFSVMTDNKADQGGAFSIHDLDNLSLEETDLSNNAAFNAGGAVQASKGKMAMIKDVTVTGIRSGSGSISLRDMENVQVSHIDFHGNSAEKRCGALDVNGATVLNLFDLTFRENVAKQDGGGLCVTKAETAKIKDSSFTANTAGLGGGAVFFDKSHDIEMSSVNFTDNYGTFLGGAVKGTDVVMLLIDDASFEGNEAQLRGAAVYLKQSSLDIQSSKVFKNYVGQPKPKAKIDIEAETEERTESESTEKEGAEKVDSESAEKEGAEKVESESTEKEGAEKVESEEVNHYRNGPVATDAGGVIYMSDGNSFKSRRTVYSYNEAEDVGGVLMVENMELVDIKDDDFLNGTASMSGGCIYGANIRNFSIWDSKLQYCDAGNGGALILEGSSKASGGYNHFNNNTARSGGAFLCKGDSYVKMEATNFSYNAAQEGATLSIDCRCDVDFSESAFFREKERRGNGDFFHKAKGCGSINLNGCAFYGKMDKNGLSTLQMAGGAGIVSVLLCFIITVIAVKRRSKKKKQQRQQQGGDIESGPSAPLIAPRPKRATYSTTEDNSSYETETESGSEYSEEQSDVEAKPSKKKASTRSIVGSDVGEVSSEEMDGSTESEDDMPKGYKTQKRSLPAVPVVPEPIGVRSAKEIRAAARRRKASVDHVNDGAGPSSAIPVDVLPPELPPQLKLSLSMSMDSESTVLPADPSIREEPEMEGTASVGQSSVHEERQPTIPEDSV